VKRARQHQRGYVYQKGKAWYLRYRQPELQPDGTSELVQKCRKLTDSVGAYRSKKAARLLADEFLTTLNHSPVSAQNTMLLSQFAELKYFPYAKDNLRSSTYDGYRNLWRRYFRPYGDIALRDVRTLEAEEMLTAIVRKHDLCRTTAAHIKSFLSGVFRYAKRLGVLNTENPMRDVVLPKARRGKDTYAYSLEEELRMIEVLPEPAATVVALASFSGLRKGELRGLDWENYDSEQISVTQSIWHGQAEEPKTPASMAPVPVIPKLGERLNSLRKLQGNPQHGPMFPNSVGKPMCLDKLVRNVIRPTLDKAGIKWHGWHAFRRGLATNLHRLGVQDKVIQAILRHSNVAVTQRCYIKTATSDAREAMALLECATSVQPAESSPLESEAASFEGGL
jgi:integrase